MIAILTKDPLLGRMLLLELERGGFSLSSPQEATVLLCDSAPQTPSAAVVIGFGDAGHFPTADHVLPLPYDTESLQALLRTYHDVNALHPIRGGVLLCGRRISLSPTEERLFALLWQHRGEVVTTECLQGALRDEEVKSNLLQALLYRLRKKLSPDGVSRIRSLRGRGYILIT